MGIGFFSSRLDVLQDTSSVTFHSSGLVLKAFRLTVLDHSSAVTEGVTLDEVVYDETGERVTLHVLPRIHAGSQAELTVRFKGELSRAQVGYCLSKLEHNDGTTQYYTFTQLAVSSRLSFLTFFVS